MKKKRKPVPGKAKNAITAWLIMLPGIALFTFFQWGPLIQSIQMSFYRTRNIELIEFVGFENYISVFRNHVFLQALGNTISYTVWSLLIGFMMPIILALLIGELVKGKGFVRTVIYIPNILPALAAIILWKAFFSAEDSGVINILRGYAGMESMAFLSNAELVIPLIVLIATWRGAGATALIYMAGLASINPQLYEAAAIDGAGIWQRIRSITMPAIYNLGSTLLILQIISIFQIMFEPLLLTAGGPDNASMSLMLLMWEFAFGAIGTPLDFGRATAVAVIIALFLTILAILYSIVNKRKVSWE